jgi:hypothetical protein
MGRAPKPDWNLLGLTHVERNGHHYVKDGRIIPTRTRRLSRRAPQPVILKDQFG